jgi:multimeric flavodoxin WrbA
VTGGTNVKKVTAFVGSARKRSTHDAALHFLKNLQSFGNVEYEIVALKDYHLELCRGCRRCLDKGEEYCPQKDDRDLLIEKLMASDGVVLASPNYSFQVSAIMKAFLDRLGFAFHRPRFFGKTFTSIVVQGIYGGDNIVKYLDFVGKGLGFNTVKGTCVTALDPMTEKEKERIDRALGSLSKRFHERLAKPPYPVPTFLNLMVFRMARTSMKLLLDSSYRDYTYFTDKGWFESEYYYPTHLNPLKKAAGSLFDSLGTIETRRRRGTPVT